MGIPKLAFYKLGELMAPLSQPVYQQAKVQPANVLGPARQIHKVVRRRLPDGRVLEFVGTVHTFPTQDGTYVTTDVVEMAGAVLDCSCQPHDPDDVVLCSLCGAVVCRRRHAQTCQKCGLARCSRCLTGVSVKGVRVIACEPCAEALTASKFKKVWGLLGKTIWG